MQKCKVHEDLHGLYVQCGGYVARPQVFRGVEEWRVLYPLPEKMPYPGDTLQGRHLPGSQVVLLQTEDGGEMFWFTHGIAYIDRGKLASPELVFRN